MKIKGNLVVVMDAERPISVSTETVGIRETRSAEMVSGIMFVNPVLSLPEY